MRLTQLSGCAGLRGCCLIAVVLAVAATAEGDDWPAWLGNQNRSGSSEEKLSGELKPAWMWRARHAPNPALAPPRGTAKGGGLGKPLVQTSTSDNAFQVVIAGGKLYFGSSVEESVTCLNGADGKRLWTFYSEGAIRFAPLCHEGKVYFGSDDGYVYCVDGESGELVWKFQAAIGERRIIANGRISSQWPVRTGLAMRDNVVYAACGVFPSEDRGVMVYALTAAGGKPVWKQHFLNHAAGHLLAHDKSLLIPTGRSSPRAMNRSDGSGQPPALGGREGEGGGSPCWVSGMLIYGPNENGFLKVRPTPDAPERTTGLKGWRMVADAERIFVLRNDGVHALDKATFSKALVASCRAFGSKEEAKERAIQWQQRLGIRQLHLKRHQQGRDEPLLMEDMKASTVWKAASEAGLVSMIRAGDLIVTGGKGLVQAHSTKDGKRSWSSKVDGTVWDLAVADGALFASTDTGAVYCFRQGGAGTVAKPQQFQQNPFPDNKQRGYRAYAKRVLTQADTTRGYCVIVGISDGRLAYEIATQSELFVLGIEPDAECVTRARKNLDTAGLYGKRVSIHQASTGRLPYLSYFANVILSETAFESGKLPFALHAVFPMLQPCGGLMVIAGRLDEQTVKRWGQGLKGWTVQGEDGLSTGSVVRGKLAGSGEWTHMFADPANTLCSRDNLVAGTRYDIQWIGSPGVERQYGWHAMSMTDLYKDGRLYLTRSDHVMAVDAYNGTMLWGLDVPGSLRLGVGHESGQACVDSDYLYVAATNDCWLIDAATGKKTRAYVLPDGKSDWGYLAIVGDLLVGSSQSPKATYNIQNPAGGGFRRTPGSRVRTIWGQMNNTQVVSTDLFALAKSDGAKRWQYKTGSHILNSSVASEGRAIFFVESRNPALPGAEDGIVFLKEFLEKDAFLVALDLKTGVKQWDKPFASKGEEVLYLSCAEGALLTVTSANTPFEGPERNKENNYYQFRLFDAKDGSPRWSTSVVGGREGYKHGVNIQPAVIMGERAYLSMRTGGRLFTFDLATGKCTETPQFRHSKGCGVMTGSGTTLFFRNMASQAYDTVSGQTFWTSSISRPSCWLNDIPAGGLVLMPEATTGCDCAFAMQVSIVLVPRDTRGRSK